MALSNLICSKESIEVIPYLKITKVVVKLYILQAIYQTSSFGVRELISKFLAQNLIA